MEQKHVDALRKIRNLSQRLVKETDTLLLKMELVGELAGKPDIEEEDEPVYRVVCRLHSDIEEDCAKVEELCNDLNID